MLPYTFAQTSTGTPIVDTTVSVHVHVRVLACAHYAKQRKPIIR